MRKLSNTAVLFGLIVALPLACVNAVDTDGTDVSANLDACPAAYTAKAYNGGDRVSNGGNIYECKPHPFSGWCGIAGAYEPGVGFAWQDAWIKIGACGSTGSGGTGSTGGTGGSSGKGGTSGTGGSSGKGGTSSTGGTGSGGTTCPAWQSGKSYVTGDVVTFNGKAYVAEHDNPGYDPTISTWFWDPYSGTCGSTGTGGTGSGGTSSTGGTSSSGGTGGSSGTCNFPQWKAQTNYPAGSIVLYNGKAYIATNANPGYDPTISTWYWSPYTSSGCGGSGTGGSSGTGGTGGSTGGTTKLDVKAGSVAAQYLPWLRQAAGECPFLDAPHLAAQIDQESRWDPNAVSWLGAQGISQFLPGTWAAFGVDANGNGKADPFEPADAIVSQGKYMCYLVGQMGAGVTWTSLLWAYNAGPEATKAAGGRAPTQEASDYAYLILTQLLPKYKP